jgi:glucose-6-phosphate dehydrogenase assembly protein OpcA
MIRLEDTSGGAVSAAIAAERHRMGSPTTGMVLTLLIMADEESQSDATSAAVTAARQHPMRIVTLIPRPEGKTTRLDAEIMVGGDEGPGEVAVLRLRGQLADHANSVAVPLLLPDTPVVAFWPGAAPGVPSDDLIGRHAQRRITDAAMAADPIAELQVRRAGYIPGDTDLAWARLTPWRSVLASVFDQEVGPVSAIVVSGERANPSIPLLAAWLESALAAPVEIRLDEGPGLTSVILTTPAGPIAIHRPDGRSATLSRPGVPDSIVAIPRRDLAALVSEELRRLDPDDCYASTLAALGTAP